MNSAFSITYKLFCGTLRLCADEQGITSISFVEEGETELPQPIPEPVRAHLHAAEEWLDAYQHTKIPSQDEASMALPHVTLHPEGTPFQHAVWEEAMQIPFGETWTYGELSRRVAQRLGKQRMSAQAVGAALRQNKVVLIIPCHRVTAAGGKLGGYMGETDSMLKRLLLAHEGKSLS
ncbi:MAG: methylated-DNA--[protein]-cysteine S-methyltransferase [Bacteroides sp.]